MGTFFNARDSLQFSLRLAGQSRVSLYWPTTAVDIFTSKTGVSLQAVSSLPQAALGDLLDLWHLWNNRLSVVHRYHRRFPHQNRRYVSD
jgi:hypothetical protein